MGIRSRSLLPIVLALTVACCASVRADYLAQSALAETPSFQSRVRIAAFAAAIAIANEPPATVNYTRRVAFAQTFVQKADVFVLKIAYGVVADETITDASTDVQLLTRVSAIWNTFAGREEAP